MHWKMSIDLSYPLIPSIGQHDPLDGFITYNELQISAKKFNLSDTSQMDIEISEMADICRGMNRTTNDPLGIGGILFDAERVAQFIIKENKDYSQLLISILDSAHIGLNSFVRSNPFIIHPDYRLAFRELGLSIGLKGVEIMQKCFIEDSPFQKIISPFLNYLSPGNTIQDLWIQNKNWNLGGWAEHREINMVMLATSLIPHSFLLI